MDLIDELDRLDERWTRGLNDFALHHSAVVPPLEATSYTFHAWVFRGLVIALAAWFFYKGQRSKAVWAVVTLTAGGLLGLLLKVVVDRPRPELTSPIAHFPGGSFPSGHAMTAVLGAALLVLMLHPLMTRASRWWAWGAVVVISIATGLCRVALGVHYVSDVAAGWLLGALVVAVAVRVPGRG